MRANPLRTNEGHQAGISKRRAMCSQADLNTYYANLKKEERAAKTKAARRACKKNRKSKAVVDMPDAADRFIEQAEAKRRKQNPVVHAPERTKSQPQLKMTAAQKKRARHNRNAGKSKVCKDCGRSTMGSKNRCRACRTAKPGLFQQRRIAAPAPAIPRPIPTPTTTHLTPENWHVVYIHCSCGESVCATFWKFIPCRQWKTVRCVCGQKHEARWPQ